MTYDQLLSQGERLVEMLGPTDIECPPVEEATEWPDFDDDGSPL